MKSKVGRTVVFIPARCGSKSIPLKNIKPINGRPLIYWALDAAVSCTEVDRVIVSTDCEDIRKVVLNYNSDKVLVIGRSERVSSDTASTEDVMLEFSEEYDYENIILVQVTSPLIKSEDISKGIIKFNQNGIDSVLSVVRQKRFLWSESFPTANAINYNPLSRPMRQEFDGYLVENGAFYITSKKCLQNSKCRISGNIGLVEMSGETYFEIDEPEDWIIVENLLKMSKNVKTELNHKLHRIKCLLTDSDGVLTDGGMYYSEHGDEIKKFNTKDGMGFNLVKEHGIITGLITGEKVELVRRRAEKMKLDIIYLGVQDKVKVIYEICEKFGITPEEIAYIGDDVNDLEVIKKVGLGCTVEDGMESLREVADYVTKAKGGQGAVREVAELILNRNLHIK